MISVKNLTKLYGHVKAVEDVSFEVKKGEIVGLLGHNGAGKTTVMKVITGYLEPTAGSIRVGDVDVLENRLAVQRQIGYLPENAPVYTEMLVQEYLLMIAELREIAPEKRNRAVLDAVAATGLEKLLVRPIATLSKGFRQRVGLAQAIIHKPDVLILDEPTNGLDPVQIVEIRGLIRKLAESSTVILSTHILSEIEAVCDRVVILIDGRIATDAPLGELMRSNRISVSVREDTPDVSNSLGSVPGIESVIKKGADPLRQGFVVWTATCQDGCLPTLEIVELARDAKWSLAEVAAETPNLEQIFGDLMNEQVSRVRSAAKEVSA